MKKIIFILIILSLFRFPVNTQWLQDIRLTNAPGNSLLSYTKNVASYLNYVFVVWYDNRDGNYEIYFKRSTDRGVTWEPDIRLTNSPQSSNFPSLAVNGLNIHIAWDDYRDNNYEIYYKCSTDGGLTWTNDVRLTNTTELSRLPSLAINGSNLFLVWEEKELYTDIYFKYSTNGGLNWSPGIVLDNGSSASENPNISISGTTIHVVWEDIRDGYTNEIYYKRSSDEGVSWSQDTRLTANSGESLYPFISSLGSDVYLTFQDNSNYHYEIYYKHSSDGGLSWGPIVNLSNLPNAHWHPAISVSGSILHVVWHGNINDTDRIFYKRSIDKGINWETSLVLTSTFSGLPAISTADSMINVLWCDYRDGNWEIYYKSNLNGNIVNLKKSDLSYPNNFSLSQNYPNPFNPTTRINFDIPPLKGARGMNARLAIYDVLGREIAVIVNQQLKPGTYEVDFDGSNYPSGVYFYRLSINNEQLAAKKMVLIK